MTIVSRRSLFIRNMVCDRCVRVVREELTNLGLEVQHIELGAAEVAAGSKPVDIEAIRAMLSRNGFELIEDDRRKIIEDIKRAILKRARHDYSVAPLKAKLSTFVARETLQEYAVASPLFSSVEGMTIEQYFILQRIERVKELLKYGELSLGEIAWQTGYSSTQHLSTQFKQVTGMTPGAFRRMGKGKRVPLDKVG